MSLMDIAGSSPAGGSLSKRSDKGRVRAVLKYSHKQNRYGGFPMQRFFFTFGTSDKFPFCIYLYWLLMDGELPNNPDQAVSLTGGYAKFVLKEGEHSISASLS